MTTYTDLLIRELEGAGTYDPSASERSAADAIHSAFQDAITACVARARHNGTITAVDLIWRMASVGVDTECIILSLNGHREWYVDEIAMLMAGGFLGDLSDYFEAALAKMTGGEQD